MINSFLDFIHTEKKKDYYVKLANFLRNEYTNYTCYPKKEDVFNAIKYCDIDNLKVVILGQDPYHEEGQAHGFAFSVKCEKLPPSLINIYKEMRSDLGIDFKQDGDLTYLANQGVLLLNSTLTVREHLAFSHAGKGWEIFTDNLIRQICDIDRPIVFILWGNAAISKEKYVYNNKHLVLKAAHPSPLSASRGFFGCHHFSLANEFLTSNGLKPIEWVKK